MAGLQDGNASAPSPTAGAPLASRPPARTELWTAPAERGPERWDRAVRFGRTRTGLTLMIVAFALLWIPYVSILGSLLDLIGVVFLFLGRHGFTPRHARGVTVGAALYGVSLLLGVVAALSFAAWIVSAVSTPGTSIAQAGQLLRSALHGLLVVGVVGSTLAALAYVACGFALADGRTRGILVAAAAARIAVSLGLYLVFWPRIDAAIAQATRGSTVDLAPVLAVQSQEAVWGALAIVPYLLFLWAYVRLRAGLDRSLEPPRAEGGGTAAYGRTA